MSREILAAPAGKQRHKHTGSQPFDKVSLCRLATEHTYVQYIRPLSTPLPTSQPHLFCNHPPNPRRRTPRPAQEHDINSLPSHFATNQQNQDKDINSPMKKQPPAASPFLLCYPPTLRSPTHQTKQNKAKQASKALPTPCVCVHHIPRPKAK